MEANSLLAAGNLDSGPLSAEYTARAKFSFIMGPQQMEEAMAYFLDDFCSDAQAILSKDQSQASLDAVALKLKELVSNPEFVATTFDDTTPSGTGTLHHDAETDMNLLAHVQRPGKLGNPHCHGASWAICANCHGYTEMTEWRRTNSESEPYAELQVADQYRIGPGNSSAYGPFFIHSMAHLEQAWVFRITGGNLDKVPRYRFDTERDKILETA